MPGFDESGNFDPSTLFKNEGGAHVDNGKLPPVYIDDSRAPGTVIHMQKDMYEFVRDWMLEGDQQMIPLTQALQNNFDSVRTNDFMLKFASGDSDYFLTPGGGVSSGMRTSMKVDTVCRCKYLTFETSGPQNGVLEVTPSSRTVLDNDVQVTLNWVKMLYREAFGAGRAEFSMVAGGGGADEELNTDIFSLDARVRMSISYLCTDQNILPSDCGCDKKINVEGEFRGELYSYADVGGFGPRHAKTKGEAGFVMSEYTVGSTFEALNIHEAEMKGSYAEKSITWDPAFRIKFGDLARAAVSGVISGGTNINDFINQATTTITGLIGNDTSIVNTSNSTSPVAVNGLGEASPDISPGTEKVFMITSLTHYENEINTNWFCEAEARSAFASAYRMHLYINYDNVNPECCVEKFGMWAHGGYDLLVETNSDFAFSTNPENGDIKALRNALITNFVGPWDNFNPRDPFGTTTSSDQTCDCNVKAVLDLVSNSCDGVTIDVSGAIYPDDYYLAISRVDADGNYLGSWQSGWFPSLPDVIDLTTSANPLGAYTFKRDEYYKITFAVKGHCTDWDATHVYFQAQGAGEAKFDVLDQVCDNVTIDISETTGALRYYLSVREVDENDNGIASTWRSTGWVNSLPDIINLGSSTGVLGYNFVGGRRYMIQLAIKTPCTNWLAQETIIEVAPTAVPALELTASCDEIIVDGTASEKETSFEILVVEVNVFGNPIGNPTSITSGSVNGEITSTYDIMPLYSFNTGSRYRVTLNVSNACSGIQSVSDEFLHSIEPVPSIDGESVICEGDEYVVNIGNSASLDEFRMEVFESTQFGELAVGASVINLTGGWVNYATQNPVVLVSPTPQITFQPSKWYTVRLYGRNSCSNEEVMDLVVVRVVPDADCITTSAGPCKAEFEQDPTLTSTPNGTDVRFIDRSEANLTTVSRAWSFGDGQTEIGPSAPEHTYASDGNYDVTLIIRDEDGCLDSVTLTVAVFTQAQQPGPGRGTGRRNGLDAGQKSAINPNPANNAFKVNYDLESNGEFKLMDVTGKEILSRTLEASSHEVKVTTTDIPAGIYIGRVIENGSVVATHKIMIAH
ncbi:MAG: PKD domain-containing protein [Bacteroidia bacterium]